VRTLVIIGAIVACLTGCGFAFLASGGFESSIPPTPRRPFEPQPTRLWWPERWHQPSNRTALLKELEAAQASWNVRRPLTYELTVSRRCFCNPGVPFVSIVSGINVLQSTGGRLGFGQSWAPPLRTVELLFSEGIRVVASEAEVVVVEFDPQFRYPRRISINDLRDVSDDEIEWIAQVRVLRQS
jgi:Family of unknown function (DUF6174)